MARRRQFLQLIYDLRAELGKAVDPAAGVADLPSLKRTLQRNYETLYDEYDWPHLSVISDRMTVNAGQRFYDFPDNMAYESTEQVVLWWNGEPVELDRGIGFEHYASYDPENDERTDPVQRWDVRYTDPREQIELWPLPASAQQIQLKGRKKFVQMVDEADICLIDDHILLLTCAVQLLPRQKSGDAQVALEALRQRMSRVKSNSKGDGATVKIGGGGRRGGDMPSKAIIRIGG